MSHRLDSLVAFRNFVVCWLFFVRTKRSPSRVKDIESGCLVVIDSNALWIRKMLNSFIGLLDLSFMIRNLGHDSNFGFVDLLGFF